MSHILIIEDDSDIASMLTHALRPLNCPIDRAVNGAEAMELIHQLHPTIVLLDLHLPYIAGETILSAIRRDPELQGVKVIIFSAYVTDEVVKQLEYPADLILRKPHPLSDLREAVRKFVA